MSSADVGGVVAGGGDLSRASSRSVTHNTDLGFLIHLVAPRHSTGVLLEQSIDLYPDRRERDELVELEVIPSVPVVKASADVSLLRRRRLLGPGERGKEVVDYIPGIPSICIADLPTIYYGDGLKSLHRALEAIARVRKAQYLLFTSIYELEAPIIDSLKATFPIPIYSIGPAIPYLRLGHDSSLFKDEINGINYLQWLDSQPKASVLYISQGSFLSVSRAQMDEIIAGVNKSGVRFLWVARGDVFRIKKECGENGVVVPWCNQLKVLCHPSIGGFWSHCGWNSTKEGVFAGLPFLTYPIFWDQVTNSKTIIEDWKIGWKVRQGMGEKEQLVTREEIGGLVHRFMDLESEEGIQMRIRAKELQEICHRATSEGGSAKIDIDAFITSISKCNGC
ncbi:7-deoxyloganetin glucosyltransferase [Sarracenia purpurea var. burkii]